MKLSLAVKTKDDSWGVLKDIRHGSILYAWAAAENEMTHTFPPTRIKKAWVRRGALLPWKMANKEKFKIPSAHPFCFLYQKKQPQRLYLEGRVIFFKNGHRVIQNVLHYSLLLRDDQLQGYLRASLNSLVLPSWAKLHSFKTAPGGFLRLLSPPKATQQEFLGTDKQEKYDRSCGQL